MKKETKSKVVTPITFKMQWQTSYTGHPYIDPDPQPSVCKPSMTLSVRELMERHTRGLETGVQQRTPIYLPDDMEVPNIQDMNDLSYRKEELEDLEVTLTKTAQDEQQKAKATKNQKSKNVLDTQEVPTKPKPDDTIPPVPKK